MNGLEKAALIELLYKHVLPFIGHVVHHRTAHLVALELRFFDAEYATDYSKLLELRAKIDGSTAGTSEHRELQNHVDAMIKRIKNDPDYENLDCCDLESLRHVLEGAFDRGSGWQDLLASLSVNWVALKLRFFDAEYATDYSKLLELRAKIDGSTAGTSEHDEALHELQNHVDAMIKRIKNDPDYENLMRVLDYCGIVDLAQRLGGSAYKELVEKRNGELEPIRRNSAEEQATELAEEQATELTEQAAIKFMEQQGELSPQELQELQQMLGDTLEQLQQAADLDVSAEELSSGFIERHADLIASALAPNLGTAPSTADLVPDLTDINDGDLLEADLLHV